MRLVLLWICRGSPNSWRTGPRSVSWPRRAFGTAPQQRAMLRGCSLDLIGLAADQVLRLDRTFGEYRQSEADVKDAGENLAAALERAEALAEQARAVIQTVAGVPQQAPLP